MILNLHAVLASEKLYFIIQIYLPRTTIVKFKMRIVWFNQNDFLGGTIQISSIFRIHDADGASLLESHQCDKINNDFIKKQIYIFNCTLENCEWHSKITFTKYIELHCYLHKPMLNLDINYDNCKVYFQPRFFLNLLFHRQNIIVYDCNNWTEHCRILRLFLENLKKANFNNRVSRLIYITPWHKSFRQNILDYNNRQALTQWWLMLS